MGSGLFRTLSSELDRYRREVAARGGREVLTFPGSESERLGRALFANLRAGGFCTLLVTGRRAWNCRDEFFEAARAAARRGRKIERAFLLPDRHLRHDKTLKEHVALDTDSGIRTRVLYVGDLIPALAATSPGSLEFGLWDDETCCMTIQGPGEAARTPREWRISALHEDIRRARDFIGIVRQKAEAVTLDGRDSAASPTLEEPVVLSAPLAYRVAPGFCHKDPVSGEDCAWYHGLWQYLRVFNLVATPQRHAGFFLDSLGSLAHEGSHRRVLISGTADYSMFAHLLRAYRRQNASVDVVDLCETPLFLCKWYARIVSAAVDTHTSDILAFRCTEPFDVICTHSFLSRFTPYARGQLVSKWRQLLRPGGKVVTTTRIDPSWSEDPSGFKPTQLSAFCDRVLQEARCWRDILAADPDEMVEQARLYAQKSVNYSVRSPEEIVDLFERGGFEMERLQLTEVPGNVSARQSGSSTHQRATYAEIVATRV